MPHYYGAAGTSNVDYRDWRPYSRHPLVMRDGYGVAFARVMLHDVRWREQPRQWVLRIASGVLVVLVYAVALVMMAVVRPAGSGSETGTGTEGSATVAVRMINQPAAATAPAPPPIVLPKRPASQASQPAAPKARQAPVAALPPVPAQAPPRPQVALAPTRPQVTAAKPTLTPPRMHLTPTPAEAPPITLPSPSRVIVEEPSSRAMPVPEPPAVQLAQPEAVAPALEPVPAVQARPEIKLSKPQLEVHAPASARVQTVAPAEVQAVLPPVPTVAPRATPERPVAELPVQVAVPQPSASVAVATPQAVLASPAQPPATQVAKPAPPAASPAASPSNSSFALANDQFKPITGRNRTTHSTSGQPGTVKVVPHGNSNVMTRNTDHLGYKSTIFDQYWAPANESILDSFLRHFIEKLTVEHTFHLAPGIRVHCVLGPVAVFLACGPGDGPRPKSAKSDDPRLDMAPARSLVPQVARPETVRPAAVPRALPGQPVSAPPAHLKRAVKCAAAKVAGGPPPAGCPGGPAPATTTMSH